MSLFFLLQSKFCLFTKPFFNKKIFSLARENFSIGFILLRERKCPCRKRSGFPYCYSSFLIYQFLPCYSWNMIEQHFHTLTERKPDWIWLLVINFLPLLWQMHIIGLLDLSTLKLSMHEFAMLDSVQRMRDKGLGPMVTHYPFKGMMTRNFGICQISYTL